MRLQKYHQVSNCKNSQQRAKTERNYQEAFIEEEQTIRGLANGAFEDFSYNDCQRGNRISKRHALMKRSLSSEQVEDLIRVFGERKTSITRFFSQMGSERYVLIKKQIPPEDSDQVVDS